MKERLSWDARTHVKVLGVGEEQEVYPQHMPLTPIGLWPRILEIWQGSGKREDWKLKWKEYKPTQCGSSPTSLGPFLTIEEIQSS